VPYQRGQRRRAGHFTPPTGVRPANALLSTLRSSAEYLL
jgi:hypothetical protein